MKVSLNWISEILKTELNIADVTNALNTIGFEIENYENKSEAIHGVVIGEVRAVQPHPKADRLTVCKVFDGQIEQTIVCGASNVAPGIKVPLASVGAVLPGNFKIKKAKIRGVESAGMICSEKELELSDSAQGIMHLPCSLLPGDDFCSAMGLNDTIIEYEVTPNRPDALSHIGIAREIAAALRVSYIPQKIKTGLASFSECTVSITATHACRRYVAQVIEGIKVGPSPQFIVQRLALCGIRSINNIVDVTNYILLETGHPLHAFDYDLLAGRSINVRMSTGESIQALDGKEYTLHTETLVIADQQKPIAIAGIIGGEETSVTAKTKNILLEAAHFDPCIIRKTAKRLDISTESSYRFERGTDIIGLEYASLKAVDLILMCAGGEKTKSKEAYPKPFIPVTIELRPHRVNAILGTDYSKNMMADILNRLNMEFINKDIAESLCFKVPSYRVDIKEEIDLIEEIARHAGYDSVPTASVSGVLMERALPETWTFVDELRSILNTAGLCEAYNYGLMSADILGKLKLPKDDLRHNVISIVNPLSSEFTLLRTTLLPGLLTNAVINESRKNTSTRLYEIGTVFIKEGSAYTESKRMAGIVSGKTTQNLWSQTCPLDFRDISGIIDFVLNKLSIADWYCIPEVISYLHSGQSAAVFIKQKKVGEFGRLHPSLHDSFGLVNETYYFEFDADMLRNTRRKEKKYTALPKYPGIKRDFSFSFKKGVVWKQIYNETVRACGTLLESIIPFDCYEGHQIKKDTYSLSFSVFLRSSERTLTDKEADAIQEAIIKQLTHTLQAKLRAS